MDAPTVTLFTSRTCPYCREIRHYLDQHRQPFTERRVDEDAEAARHVVSMLGDELVPMVLIERPLSSPVTIVGFDRQRLDALLEVRN